MPSNCTQYPRIPVYVLRHDRESHGTETDRAREGHADGWQILSILPLPEHLPPGESEIGR